MEYMNSSPPPLKSLAAEVAEELGLGRGDPAELRRLDGALSRERDRVFYLQRMLDEKNKELKTTTNILELRIAELEKRLLQSQEENARLRVAVNPEDLGQFDEIMRVINRERVMNQNTRDRLQAERESFEAEKSKFQRLSSDKVKQGFVLGVVEAAESSVIAQRVQDFVRKYADASVEEIREIRESLEQVLTQKIDDLDNCRYCVFYMVLVHLSCRLQRL